MNHSNRPGRTPRAPAGSPAGPEDPFSASQSPSPAAPSPNFRGFGFPTTPVGTTTALPSSPRSVSQSPRKTANPTTGSALQLQISQLRTELVGLLEGVEKRLGDRIALVEQDVASLKEEDGPIGRIRADVTKLGTSVTQTVGALKGSVANLSDDLDRMVTESSPTKEPGFSCTGVQYNAVQGVIRSVVKFLYGTDQPYPEYPTDPNQPWPLLPSHDPLAPPSQALRFDFSTSYVSAINAHAINAVMDYVERNRGRWPCDPGDSATASSVETGAFRKALCKHFEYLRDSRNRRIKAEMLSMTAGMFSGAEAGTGSGDESLRMMVPPSESESGGSSPSKPTAQARRSKKKTLAAAVKQRRAFIPAYAGPNWSILDQIHSQMMEYPVDGKRVWAVESWMSDMNRDALLSILTSEPSTSDRATLSKLAHTSRAGQAFGSLVIDQPMFPQSHSTPPSLRMQSWQFNPDWLATHLATNYFNIVPVNIPTSPADVAVLPWSLTHPNRPMAPPPIVGARAGDKRQREDDAAMDLSDDGEGIDGLDHYSRPVARSRSRSVSPEKRANIGGAVGDSSEAGGVDDAELRALMSRASRPSPSAGPSNRP